MSERSDKTQTPSKPTTEEPTQNGFGFAMAWFGAPFLIIILYLILHGS